LRYKHITIEGNIGSGKTTLSNLLAQSLDARLILETFADNPFLPKFYEKPEQFAFQLEMSFLAERYKQLKSLLNTSDLFKSVTVTDYLFIKCKLFAKSNLSEDEFMLFQTVFDIIYPNLPEPDLLIYLHCPVESLQINIKKRARPYEQSIPDEYLQKIHDAYWGYLKNIQIPTLVIDSSTIDFANDDKNFNKIFDLLNNHYKAGLNYIEFM
jgi:deoxyguanosine kinase